MIHDDECVWIGLFLIDQDKQNCGLGKRLFNDCLKKFKQRCERIQLACLVRNEAGLVFWKSGFSKLVILNMVIYSNCRKEKNIGRNVKKI